MTRQKRQNRIIELITDVEIGTQTELAEFLNKEGYAVTQATVSRDIKELGLMKVITEDKNYKYVAPERKERRSRHINLFRESVISIEKAMNIIVVKTITGSANSACTFIDKMQHQNIVGTLAGDDTLLVITKTLEDTETVYRELQKIYNK